MALDGEDYISDYPDRSLLLNSKSILFLINSIEKLKSKEKSICDLESHL